MKNFSDTMRTTTTLITTAFLVGAVLAPMTATGADDKTTAGEAKSIAAKDPETDLDAQVAEYLRLFPYQETYRYAMVHTGGDPAKLNTWIVALRKLLK
jgi:hypothetical protein